MAILLGPAVQPPNAQPNVSRMARLANRTTSSGRSSYFRPLAYRASVSPREICLLAEAEEGVLSCVSAGNVDAPIATPAAAACPRK